MGLAGRFAFRRKRYPGVDHGESRSLIHERADARRLDKGSATDLDGLQCACTDQLVNLGVTKPESLLGAVYRYRDGFHVHCSNTRRTVRLRDGLFVAVRGVSGRVSK
jgi:hypothetical protein